MLTAKRARDEGFSKLTADTPVEVAKVYQLSGRSTADDPTLGQVLRPVWIKIDGPLDTVKRSYLTRRIEQARQEKVNLVFFDFNSEGGIDIPADAVADMIAGIKDMKTVAFINDRAIGVSILAALACNEIVFRKEAEMGDVRQLVVGRGQVVPLNDGQIARSPIGPPTSPDRRATLSRLPGRWSIPMSKLSRPPITRRGP